MGTLQRKTLSALTLDRLYQDCVRVLRHASNTRPAILLMEIDGKKVLVKDFSRNRAFYAKTIGRFLVWREAKAYCRLQGLRGIPRFYGVIDSLAIAMEYVDAPTLKEEGKKRRLGSDFFHRLEELIASIHARGMAHCDLKKAPNILVAPGDEPYLVDWGASISEREFRPLPLSWIYKRFVADDFMAVIKMKLRFAPELVTAQERSSYQRRSLPEKAIRKIRDKARELLQRLV